MSIDEKINAPTATAIRDEVHKTVQQLEKLVGTEKDFDQFCDTVLSKVVKITGAHGALFWQINGEADPQLTHRAGKLPSPVARDIISNENHQHNTAVMDVVRKQTPLKLNSESFGRETENADNSFLMLFTPVYNRTKKCCGALELLQRGDVNPQAQEGYLRFLSQISQLFPQWHEKQDPVAPGPAPPQMTAEIPPRDDPDPVSTVHTGELQPAVNQPVQTPDAWHDRLEFISEVHRSIDQSETAYSVANEARRLLKCDRVSVARWTGRKCKIDAISSQDRFDNRSNVVRLLSNVATASVSSDSPFWIIGNTEGIAPEVAKKINEYLDESHSRTLVVIPLSARLPETPDLEMKSRRKVKATKLGALILEYFDADILESEIESDCKLIVEQSELALENARKHSEIFMLPIWKRLGWLQQTLFRDHRSRTYTGLGCLALLVLFLLLFPKELKMKVDGVMHPTVRRTIFAQTDGDIIEVLIDDREVVTVGQPLLILQNRDLELQLEAKGFELETVRHQLASAEQQLSIGRQDYDEERQLGTTIDLFRKKIETYQTEIRLLKLKKSRLEIMSPIDGTVITPQPKRRYQDYPATKDMALLEVAALDGAWQLELKIPGNKVFYVDEALRKRADNDNLDPLDVEFKISTDPNLNLHGTLTSISRRLVPSESGSPEIRAIVEIAPGQLETLRAALRSGAGATAKIKCGRRSLGFVCFYQIWDYMRTKVFF